MVSQEPESFPFIVKPCSDKGAFEVRPKRNVVIEMDKARRAIRMSSEHQMIVETPHIMIVRTGEAEITLSRDGRMLVKRVSNQNEATRAAYKILRILRVALKSV